MGQFPDHQSRREDAHTAGPAWEHPEFHPYFRRKAARCTRTRYDPARGRRDLRHGSGVCRLRAIGLHQAGAFFVTRAKSNLNAHRVYSTATDRTTGVIADQKIALDGHYTSQDYPIHIRRVRFRDPETEKTLVFLTNQTTLPALTICDLYKSRWQVELFFKWIKQHLRIKTFYGTSENAVKTQIWIAVSVYVLVAIVRKRLKLDVSLYTLMQVFSVTVFERSSVESVIFQTANSSVYVMDDNQLNLFGY